MRRCASCSTGPTGAGCGSILDGVFNHTGRGFWPFHHILENAADSPYRDWFHLDPEVLAGRRLLTPYPPLDAHDGLRRSATRRGGGCRRCPSSTPTTRRSREYLLSVAEYWLRFGIDGWRLDVPNEIEDPVVLGRIPPALPGDPARRLSRRGDLGGRARLGRRRPVRRADGLPAGRGDPRVRRRAEPGLGDRQRPPRVPPARPRRSTGRGSRLASSSSLACTTPTSSPSSSTSSARTTPRGR